MKKVPQIPATELKVNNICGFYIRTVTAFGTSAKVDCPKEHLGTIPQRYKTGNENEVRL